MKEKMIKVFRIFYVIACLHFSSYSYSQDNTPTTQSNNDLEFSEFVSGIKYAYVALSDNDVKNIKNNSSGPNAQAILGIIDYLKEIGISKVSWGSVNNNPENIPSLCDLVMVFPTWEVNNASFTNITLNFVSCNKDIFKFVSEKNIWVTGYTNIRSSFFSRCMKMYNTKLTYSSEKRIKLISEMSKWTEESLKKYFQNTEIDKNEGIYEAIIDTKEMAKYKLGVVKSDNSYDVIYLSGANNHEDWLEGENKAILNPTATSGIFKVNWKMNNKKKE
jgi:hypothetical protein